MTRPTFPLWQAGLAIAALIVLIWLPDVRGPAPAPVAAPQPELADDWSTRAAAAASVARSRPGTVSFAVVDAGGREVAAYRAGNPVPAASTIKALILAAYLRQPDVADRDLTAKEQARMTAMITWSSNSDASRLLKLAGWPALDAVAAEAGMQGGYIPDHQSWGLTQISAGSMAKLFHRLPELLPDRHREFALGLFGEVVPAQQWGMATATPADWSWHIKGGWIAEAVNQLGTFTRGGEEFTIAVTVEGDAGTGASVSSAPDSVPAVKTIERITRTIFGTGDIPDSQPRACGSVAGAGQAEQAPSWAGPASCVDLPDAPA